MSPKHQLAMLLAALCHDLEHPGVDSVFLKKSNSALTILYGTDSGCLERHHRYGTHSESLHYDHHATCSPPSFFNCHFGVALT